MKNETEQELIVLQVNQEDLLQEAFAIRKLVFVEEQRVSENEEYDEFEESSRHFIAILNGQPVATARWRKTDLGIKLERFAVLKPVRGKGVGGAILQTVLEDVRMDVDYEKSKIYLHAQLDAIPFYSAFNFVVEGDRFIECNILHYKMYLKK